MANNKRPRSCRDYKADRHITSCQRPPHCGTAVDEGLALLRPADKGGRNMRPPEIMELPAIASLEHLRSERPAGSPRHMGGVAGVHGGHKGATTHVVA